MNNSNFPARKQGNVIRRKFYYDDYRQVQRVVDQLEQQEAFEHQSERRTDEKGTYVVISYRDPMVVASDRPSSSAVPVPANRRQAQYALSQGAPTRPVYRRWWFVPSVAVTVLGALCAVGYWAVQQLALLSAPNLGVGLVGFAFVVVLIVWIVKNISGGSGGSSSGGHGFHWTPCD